MSEGLVVSGRYRILRELGRGGMGVVYLVEHLHTGDHLALKLLIGNAALDRGAVERFKREARASARIKSENVVRVMDADTSAELGGAPFLVMELLNGRDLEKELVERGTISPADVFSFLTQAARALDKSHAIGLVHRDLKPENLFLHTRDDGSSIVKVVDFGISKLVGGEALNDLARGGLTNTGVVIGTPLFMAPEQALGASSSMGPHTDVWAMGLIALRLLTGEIYWKADTVAVLMVQLLTAPMYAPTERWPWLPPAIDAWFARSCAREPSLRFAGVGEQVQALGQALGLAEPSGEKPESRSSVVPGVSASPGGLSTEDSKAAVFGAGEAARGAGTLLPGAQTTTRPLVNEPSEDPATEGARRVRLRRWSTAIFLALALLGAAAWAVARRRPVTSPASAISQITTEAPIPHPAVTPAQEPTPEIHARPVPSASSLASASSASRSAAVTKSSSGVEPTSQRRGSGPTSKEGARASSSVFIPTLP